MPEKWAVRLIAAIMMLGCCTLSWGQTDAQKLFFEGYEFLKDGKAKDAIPKFEVGLKAEPKNALARFYLGEALFATGQRDKAKEQLRQSLDLDANSSVAADARKRLGELTGNPFASGNDSSGNGGGSFPAAGTVSRDCSGCPDMVVVPDGQFVMGSPPSETGRFDDEGPPHLVTIAKPFAVGKYEVTFNEWEACVRDKGCAAVTEDEGWGRGSRPVINVSYEQAIGYAKWLADKTGKKYRLLSEAEWEYAARAGSDKARFWGSSPDHACQFANVGDARAKARHPNWTTVHDCDDGYAETSPVGSFAANAFGLHDMLGNVWEWVEDCYNETYDGAPTDGRVWATGDCSRRVIRGSSWFNVPAFVRSAIRDWGDPTYRLDILGFRVARTLP